MPTLGLPNLQAVYNALPTPPHLTINGTPDPLTIDASTTGDIQQWRDAADAVLMRVGDGASDGALLQLNSTTQGFLPTRMTTAQRTTFGGTLGAGDEGMLVFDTDLDQLHQWTGSTFTIPGSGLTTLQGAYNNDPTGAQIVLDGVPNPVTVQASVAGDVLSALDLAGNPILNVEADPDMVTISGNLTIDDAFDNAGAANSIVMTDTAAYTAGFVGGGILSSGTVSWSNALWIWALLQESKLYQALVGPGFSAFTLFNALAIMENGANVNLTQSIILNNGMTHRRVTAGTSTVTQNITVSCAPSTRTLIAGATMRKTTGDIGLQMSPTHSGPVGSTVDLGTTTAVRCAAPAVALFGDPNATEIFDAYYGLDFLAMTHVTGGDKVVVRSAMTDAADRYFLQNNGGARSDFGGGDLFDLGITQHLGDGIGFSSSYGAAGGDTTYYWDGSRQVLNPSSGDDLRWTLGTGFHTLDSSNADPELRLDFNRINVGSAASVGNQTRVYTSPARTTQVNGEWADDLHTAAGNLTIANTMSGVFGLVYNAQSLTIGAGSITGPVATLNIGGMTTSSLSTATSTSAIRSTGRFTQRGMVRYPPIDPAEITGGPINAWSGLLTGSQNNNGRRWARVTLDGAQTINGIDSTAAIDGDTYDITNVDAVDTLTLVNAAGAAAAADRILLGSHSGTVAPDDTVTIRYDGTSARWRVVHSN